MHACSEGMRPVSQLVIPVTAQLPHNTYRSTLALCRGLVLVNSIIAMLYV